MSSGKTKRTRLKPEERRRQLLDIGVALVLGAPLEEVTVERVAAEAEVSRALVFHYFPTVRELHLAAVAEISDQVVERVAERVASLTVLEEQLDHGLDEFASIVFQQPRTFATLAGMAAMDEEFALVFDRVRAAFVELILAQSGRPRSPLLETLLWGWEAMVEQSLIRWADDPSVIDRARVIEDLALTARDILNRHSS